MSHPIEKDPSIQLKDGAEWADHEDCLIGNRAGIESLHAACVVALEEGEYCGSDLGDYVGLKIMENSWFADPKDSSSSQIGAFVAGIVIFCFLGLTIVGAFTVGRVFFGLFT